MFYEDSSKYATPRHPICEEFDDWLDRQGFCPAVDVCPVEHGDFLFTDGLASDWVDEFLATRPTCDAVRQQLEDYAGDIGEIVNPTKWTN